MTYAVDITPLIFGDIAPMDNLLLCFQLPVIQPVPYF